MANILTEVILTAKEELDQALNKANNVIPQIITDVNKSLDDIDKKLEETKELVDGAGAASKQEVEEVKSSLEQKANKSDVGTPLIVSSVNEMLDKTKVYVNTTDGKWYTFNGSYWKDGGLYNSQGIADKSINPIKTTFFNITYGKNLLNKNDPNVLFGKYINDANGVVTNALYNETGYISVEPNRNYAISDKGRIIKFYNENKQFISSIKNPTTSNAYFTTPDNAYFLRATIGVENWNNAQIEIGNASTIFEEFTYSEKINKKYIEINNKNESVYEGFKFTSYGDSITERNKWQPFVVDYFKFIHTNLGIGSTSVAYKSDVDENTYPCFVNSNRIQAIKDSNPDVITLLGGTNDANRQQPLGTNDEFIKPLENKDKSTVKGAWSYLIETLLVWKPSLEIIMCTPLKAINTTDYSPYADAVLEVAKFYSLPCVNLYYESKISKFTTIYFDDSLHPSSVDGKRIANMVIDKILEVSRVQQTLCIYYS